MKYKIKISLLAIVTIAVFFGSCKKNYLTRDPYTAVAFGSAITSEADLSVALNGVYAGLRSTNLFGRDLPVKGDLMADNTFITTSNSNRYITMNNFTMTAASGDYGGLMWTAAYVVIKNANNVITSVRITFVLLKTFMSHIPPPTPRNCPNVCQIVEI